ncbi:hypothetical protein IZY60_14560 [Lutibacter sp. B2]|nr:hypothetical protein [Lutibacter sp. B2]
MINKRQKSIGGLQMKCRQFYYVVSNFEKNEIFSCGAKFTEFMEFITIKPENILLLKSDFGCGKYYQDIGLDYVDSENMKDLINDDVYSYGNFCWIDYKNISSLDNMAPTQLSELLYISHRFKPLYSPHVECLNNNYLYLAHDDDYWTNIYMKDICDYKHVIHGKILKELKGRKKHIESLPNDIIDYIFENSKDGILIDFENINFYEGKTSVRIYKLGKNYNYDKIFDVFKRKENFTKTEVYLEYSSRTQKWSMFSQWK